MKNYNEKQKHIFIPYISYIGHEYINIYIYIYIYIGMYVYIL